MYGEWHAVCDFVVLSVVEVCADYVSVNVFMFVLTVSSSMVLGFVSLSVLLYVGYIIRSSKEQGCASWEHCNMCAVISSAFPQVQVVSPV